MLYHFLTQQLRLFLLGSYCPLGDLDPQHILSTRIEELEVAVLLLEILLATLQDSDCISDKIQACARLVW
jgi:hypothetical protein